MIITQTPLRLSFFGGNTDFPAFYKKHGGGVLTTAIDKYIYCIISERFDKKIYVNYSKKEIVDRIEELEHELVREAMKKVGVKDGVEITFLADIPSEGSGLGSSSSVVVGVLNALYHYRGLTPTAQRLAEEAVEIELKILKKPIGIQDQYIAAYGGLRLFDFAKSGKITNQKLELSKGEIADLNNHLMLFFTGQTRQASSILANLKQDINKKTKSLMATKKLTQKAYHAVVKGDMKNFGQLLDQGWILKRALSENITNDTINKMYDLAKNAGAMGGKVAGAGGGGFLLLVVPSEKRAQVRRALKKFQEMPFHLEHDGSKVIFNVRRY